MNNANDFHSISQWEVEEKHSLKPIRNEKPAHALQFRPPDKKPVASLRLTGKHRNRCSGSPKKSVGCINAGVLRVTYPLRDEITLRGVPLAGGCH